MGRNGERTKEKKTKNSNTVWEERLSAALMRRETVFHGAKDTFATVFVTQLSGYVLGKEGQNTQQFLFFFIQGWPARLIQTTADHNHKAGAF